MEKTKKGLGLFALVSILAVCIVLLVAFCAPVSAATNGCPSETKYHGTIDGGIYFKQADGGAGFCDATEMTVTFDNVPAGIEIARVYTGVWQGSPGKGGKFTIKVGNHRDTYTACDPC
ncbi:MAG: hypothetical protein KAT65_08685, partial [Methanophagales archaeon]|nr:hypothetical protein [Methanophagales archaeon]